MILLNLSMKRLLANKEKYKVFLAKVFGAVVVFVLRLHVLPPNVSALGAYGFFGNSISLFFFNILVFDYLVGGHYKGYLFTYLAFLAYPLFSKSAQNSTKKQVLYLPLASFVFFLVSNFGVWLYWYPHTIDGLLKCYLLALPFYRNTLIGDLVFGWGYLVVRIIINKLNFRDHLNFA